jgi:copper resistance protein C
MTLVSLNRRSAIVALLCAFLVAVPAAFAHTHPVSMTPAANSSVAAPTSISITFSGELEAKFSTITVAAASGKVVSVAKSVVDPKDTKIMNLALPKLPAGVYTVTWVAVSMDSHREKESYKFTITP